MRKLPDSIQAFIDKLKAHNEEENRKPIMERDICPIATDPQEALQILCDLFLGEKWYVGFPLGVKQVNTLIVDDYGWCGKLLDADSETEVVTSEMDYCSFGEKKD